MSIGKGRVTALVAAVVAIMALAVGGTAWANGGNSSGGGCPGGSASGAAKEIVNSASFTLCKHSNDPHDVTGYFQAAGIPPSNILVAPQGPVTCAVFRGDEVSFLYPLTEGSRPPFPPNTTAILIYAKAGGPGVGKLGFTPPLPTATFANNCDFTTPQSLATQASAQPVTAGSYSVTPPRS